MNVISVAVAKEPSCPACSRYDFEEKLLERVLRNELAIETMLKEIRETNVKVESALNLMQGDRKKIEATLDALDKSKGDMKSQLNNAISSGMTNMSEAVSDLTRNASMTISQIKKETAVLKDQLSIPTVYFHAQYPADVSLDSGQVVVYSSVRVNEGQGYDQNTGRFTVSIPGLYAFTVQSCATSSKNAFLAIVRDGTEIQVAYFHTTTDHQCVSMQAFVKLAPSMKIWVQSLGTSSLTQIRDSFNSFSGVLLHL
ncbi:hypothetical protein DPMN_143351 [Dreissena polymorpha]|uniref:C1q domain-containing protein n=1 Tax=Dreissena polymorpha TaxID=45954 RepID=A0A9D4GDI4_DREPO|nr:hypothetical protein DPMN_143351 [Dreissena polymorpha]